MRFADSFRNQHDELLGIADELAQLLDVVGLSKRAGEARGVIHRLSATLNLHLAVEDKSLYPTLMASPNLEVQRLAKQFALEMGGIASAYKDYASRWTAPEAIETDPGGFCSSSNEMLAALRHRIERENAELYPTADRAAA